MTSKTVGKGKPRIDFNAAIANGDFIKIARKLAKTKSEETVRFVDPMQTGLMVLIRADSIRWVSSYTVIEDGRRRQVVIGSPPNMSLEKARFITDALIKLGAKGFDPFDTTGRIVREVLCQGTDWRPVA